ncbi:MAG: GMC family oxidoreductase N-terminal domain-containing protein, partial [Myxococcales bacterium]|nr:GMC family oxidoreductase N-terminal domain-containing protein [Myxococcales bacterium]
GSAAVNAMVTVLPSPNDWNRLATLTGDAGFRATAMERHYASVLEWLSVELPDATLTAGDDVVQSFLAGAVATHREVDLGMPLSPAELAGTLGSLNGLLAGNVNDTLISAEATGVFRLPLATKAGHRFGPRERLIAARRDNLEIRTGAFVTRVIWDFDHEPPRARGVAYVQQESVYGASLAPQAVAVEEQEAVTEGEVILSAGAFNSPQLLMLSGVGDPVALAQLGITPVIEAPAVGHNLQDRYEAAVVTEVSRPLQVLAGCRLDEPGSDDPCLADWEEGRGVYTTPGFLATLLTKSPGSALANLQIFAAPTDARGYYPCYALDAASYRDRFTWLILEGHTHNRDGVVELRDASPFARPSITFNSYDEAAPLADPDLRAMVHGVHVVRKIREQAASLLPEATTLSEIWPGATVPEDDDDALAAWIRRESWGHHACCTNPIGADGDPNAVLDARFRVRGAVGLRVVDASVFPEIPGTFIALPTYMIAEKAAQTLLEDTP